MTGAGVAHPDIEDIPGLFAILGPDGTVQAANRRVTDYCGQSGADLKQWATNGTLHPDDLPDFATVFAQSIASGAPWRVRMRVRRFDGVHRWFDNEAAPVRDAAGRIACWYVLLNEIDDLKAAESALRESQRNLERLITDQKTAEARLRLSEGFLAKAQELSLTGSFSWSSEAPEEFTWSEEMYRIFEFTPGSPVTVEGVRDNYHPEDRHLIDAAMVDANFGVPVDFEHRIVLADGRTKHLHVFATMDRQNSSHIEYFGAVQDITQRRLGQEALEKVRAELAHATRVMSLGTLTASIAHEVSQPLSGVITNANTGLRMLAADPPNIQGAMETARRTIRDGRRASDILVRLRSLFRKKELAADPIDLNEAASEVVALTRYDLKRHQVSVETLFDQGLPSVTADRVQLQQVILNLILNAADAVRPVASRPRRLVVRTERDDDAHVRLTVCDNGVGIAPDDLGRLFDPFFTTKSDGMGIGLSVSRDIVERHNGRLSASPNADFGVTFQMSLPCGAGAET